MEAMWIGPHYFHILPRSHAGAFFCHAMPFKSGPRAIRGMEGERCVAYAHSPVPCKAELALSQSPIGQLVPVSARRPIGQCCSAPLKLKDGLQRHAEFASVGAGECLG